MVLALFPGLVNTIEHAAVIEESQLGVAPIRRDSRYREQ
jgi:hypothetical protein